MIELYSEPVIRIIEKHLSDPDLKTIVEKTDGSFVTNVDDQISNDLENLFRNEFDDVAVVSEENDDRNYDAKNIFMIDPLDGTENFISGSPFYGTSIAHFCEGVHQRSMLYFPKLRTSLTDYTWFSKTKPFNSRIVALSSYLNPDEIKAAKGDEFEEYRIIGCAVYNIFGVVSGQFKRYENPRVNSWDILAGINIALKNGINVEINGEKYDGEFLPANQKYQVKVSR